MTPNCNASMLDNSADSFKYFRHSHDKITMITAMGGVLCNIPNGCFSNASHSHELWLDPRMPCLVSASQLFEVVNFTIEALSKTVNSSQWFENIQSAFNGDKLNTSQVEYENVTLINNRYDITDMNFINTNFIRGKELAIGLSIGAVIVGLLAAIFCYNREHFKNFHITY